MNKSLVDSIEALLEANAIKDRSFVIRSGHIPTLVRNAIGVVTINSTVGISALHHHTPLKVMGRCFFDIPGLTHQGSLDEFWGRPDAVDPALYAQFRRCIEFETQINGSFYGPFPEMDRGIDRARHLGR
jgi:capsule polysaccharide modification protein KpsS